MPVDYNTLAEYAEKHNLQRASQRRFLPMTPPEVAQAKRAVDEGRRAKEVVDHPAWEMFVRRINDLVSQTERSRDMSIMSLLNAEDTTGDTKHRFRIKELDGALAAYATVLSIIPTLIRDAAQAAADFQ